MAEAFNIIDYMSGLSGFVLDDSVYRRIATERGVLEARCYEDLTERDRDLLLADILYVVLVSPNTLPSIQHQHGQFSTSIGNQPIRDKDALYRLMMRLYRKWKEEKEEISSFASELVWKE